MSLEPRAPSSPVTPLGTEVVARESQGCLQLCPAKKVHLLPCPPQIIYLRRFKDLRALSLSGNPIAEAEDYKMFVWAYLPDLVYLDSRRIDDHMASVSLWVSQLCETVLRSLVSGKGTLRQRAGQLPPPRSFPRPLSAIPAGPSWPMWVLLTWPGSFHMLPAARTATLDSSLSPVCCLSVMVPVY